MKTRRKVLIGIISGAAGISTASRLGVEPDDVPDIETGGKPVPEDAHDHITVVDTGLNVYKYDKNDHDAKIKATIDNNHPSRSFNVNARMTPLVGDGFGLKSKKNCNTIPPGEAKTFTEKWESGSDKEKGIEDFKLEIKVCNKAWIDTDCTRWVEYETLRPENDK